MKTIATAIKNLMRRKPKRIAAAQHGIDTSDIDGNAKRAVSRLQKAGFETYVVGGAVRDLLLNVSPKDFDLATAATPPEVRKLFRRSRIIGRRFKIVHLPVHRRGERDIIEVTTFRADGDEVVHNEQGRILTDNFFGNAGEDAVRRDFSCNALFYNPTNGQIVDYVGGYEDILRRRLSVIGAPDKRFQQDPVRMLRALRMEFKLGLAMNKSARNALRANADLLSDIAPSRLFDEAVKMLLSGAAVEIFAHCAKYGIIGHFLPVAEGKFARYILQTADSRHRDAKQISLSFILAGLFWPPVAKKWHEIRREGAHSVRAMESAITSATFSDNGIVPRRLIARVMDLYFLQARLCARMTVRRATAIVRNPLFSRALAFAELCDDEHAAADADWWRRYGNADAAARQQLIKDIDK